tara:strand:+ start:511 stop:654 length:144 start_codon:yes stop_codon:yes gene_type:complete
MGKRKYIKIPAPKWRWWQVAIILIVTILAFKTDANQIIELFIMWLKS